MNSLGETPFASLLEAISAKTPAPGGGAVASATGALAAALAGMVVSYSIGKKNLAAHEAALQESAVRLQRARALFLRLAEEDAAAYSLVNDLSRRTPDDPARAGLPAALKAAVDVPLAVMAASTDLLRHAEALATITNRHLRSDLAIAGVLAEAACRSAWWNVAINASMVEDAAVKKAALAQGEGMLKDAEARRARVDVGCAV